MSLTFGERGRRSGYREGVSQDHHHDADHEDGDDPADDQGGPAGGAAGVTAFGQTAVQGTGASWAQQPSGCGDPATAPIPGRFG